MNKKCDIAYIYTLKDPDTLKVRYVGQSINPLRRYKEHIQKFKVSTNPKESWIQRLFKRDTLPILEIVDSCSIDIVLEVEKEYISKFENLTNSSNSKYYTEFLELEAEGVLYPSITQNSKGFFIVSINNSYCGSFSSKVSASKVLQNLLNYYNKTGVVRWDILKARQISTRLHRLRNYKSPYKGITWNKKIEVYLIFDPQSDTRHPNYITSHKDLETARQIQLDYLNGKSIEEIQAEKVIAHRNKYRGVSFSNKDKAYLVTLQLPGEKKYKLLAQFPDEEVAKTWHDRVAAHYNLPTNETPDYTISFKEAKKAIRAERNKENPHIGVGRSGNKYIAKICLEGKSIHLGSYNTEKEALYFADASRNYYGLSNNNTTKDKLSIEQIKPTKEKCSYKNIRLDNKTGKYVVAFQNVRPKLYVGEYKTEEEALYSRDCVAKHLNLPTLVHHECPSWTKEQAQIEKTSRLEIKEII